MSPRNGFEGTVDALGAFGKDMEAHNQEAELRREALMKGEQPVVVEEQQSKQSGNDQEVAA